MRILALTSWWPEPADNGSRLRILSLLRALTCAHEVHLVAFSQVPLDQIGDNELRARCASVRAIRQPAGQITFHNRLGALLRRTPASAQAMWSPAFAQATREVAALAKPDVVIAFQILVAPYALLIEGVPRILEEVELAVLLEQFTKQQQRGPHLRYWLTWAKHRAYVSQTLRGFAACTAVSAREAALVRALVPPGMPVAVIPNGADLAGEGAASEKPEPDTLIYPGALSFDANLDAMRYFVGAIFPRVRAARPAARLRITGRATPEQRAALGAGAGVELTGFVPDVRPLVARSWAEVVPLRQGGGTRLKVLEALALGTPVVATAKGAEGLDLRHGEHILIADDPAAFAAATTLLLSQPTLRAHLARNGLRRVQATYDWRTIGAQLTSLAEEIAGRRTYVYASA